MREPVIPHPCLGAGINRSLAASAMEGGVYLAELDPAVLLEIETEHHLYLLVPCGGEKALISGHPAICPHPVTVVVAGSGWGGSLLKPGFIGRGMRLEFRHPSRGLVSTSKIRDIRHGPQPRGE